LTNSLRTRRREFLTTNKSIGVFDQGLVVGDPPCRWNASGGLVASNRRDWVNARMVFLQAKSARVFAVA